MANRCRRMPACSCTNAKELLGRKLELQVRDDLSFTSSKIDDLSFTSSEIQVKWSFSAFAATKFAKKSAPWGQLEGLLH